MELRQMNFKELYDLSWESSIESEHEYQKSLNDDERHTHVLEIVNETLKIYGNFPNECRFIDVETGMDVRYN